jgi:CheY-like chemotaxis protein
VTKILYIEDDADHRSMMHTALTSHGFAVEMAQDGKEGLIMAREIKPDMILLDLYMPKMDGFGVMKHLKEDPATQDIPIAVVSAWPTGDHRRRAREAGALGFVAKPFKPEALIDLIQENLSPQAEPLSAAPDTNSPEET